MKSVIAVIIGAVIIYAVILRITEDSGVSKNAPEGFISPKLEDNRRHFAVVVVGEVLLPVVF